MKNAILRTACLLATIAVPCDLAKAQTTVPASVTVVEDGPKTTTTTTTCNGTTCTRVVTIV